MVFSSAISQTGGVFVMSHSGVCVSSIGSAESIPGCRFLGQLAGELRDNLPVNRVVRVASASGRLLGDYGSLWCTVSQRDRAISQGRGVYYERLKGLETGRPLCLLAQ